MGVDADDFTSFKAIPQRIQHYAIFQVFESRYELAVGIDRFCCTAKSRVRGRAGTEPISARYASAREPQLRSVDEPDEAEPRRREAASRQPHWRGRGTTLYTSF